MNEVKCANCFSILEIVSDTIIPCGNCRRAGYLQGYMDGTKDALAKLDKLIKTNEEVKHEPKKLHIVDKEELIYYTEIGKKNQI